MSVCVDVRVRARVPKRRGTHWTLGCTLAFPLPGSPQCSAPKPGDIVLIKASGPTDLHRSAGSKAMTPDSSIPEEGGPWRLHGNDCRLWYPMLMRSQYAGTPRRDVRIRNWDSMCMAGRISRPVSPPMAPFPSWLRSPCSIVLLLLPRRQTYSGRRTGTAHCTPHCSRTRGRSRPGWPGSPQSPQWRARDPSWRFLLRKKRSPPLLPTTSKNQRSDGQAPFESLRYPSLRSRSRPGSAAYTASTPKPRTHTQRIHEGPCAPRDAPRPQPGLSTNFYGGV